MSPVGRLKGIPWHDTLYAHHAVVSHFPQKLDQLVSTYLDAAPWKIAFGRRGTRATEIPPEEMSGDDLCRYNAADCRLTSQVWARMQADLDAERHVYEHDLSLARLCSDLSLVGIRIDRKCQASLSRDLGALADSLRGQMCKLLGDPDFRPGSNRQVAEALYGTLGLRRVKSTPGGAPATDKEVIENLRALDTPAGRFADLLSRRREALKIKSTYVDWPVSGDKEHPQGVTFALPGHPDPDRAHYSWGPRESRRGKATQGGGHTVSGRLASRIQSCPRYNPRNLPDRVREMYVAAPGHTLVYFDVRQGEPKVAAYLSGDPERIEAAKGDVHTANARVMFPEASARGLLDGDAVKDPARGKALRDLAKSSGLAIDYMAEAQTLQEAYVSNSIGFDGSRLFNPPSLNACSAIIAKIRHRYRAYVAFVEANHRAVKACGYMRSPILGRIRWLGWYPPITDVANYPVQSCLADVVNLRTLALARYPSFLEWARRHPSITARVGLEADPSKWPRLPAAARNRLVLQVHDSCTYDVPRAVAKSTAQVILDIWSRPVSLPGGALTLTIDQKEGERWSDLG